MTQQDRVFEVCGMPVVRDLFRGYNTLLFSYGVTNSGKTHTVTGSADDPGVLPRSVAAILDVLDRQGAQGDFAVRPKYATQVEFCSDPRVTAPTFRVAPGEDRWVDGLHRRSDDVDAAVKMISDELAADGGREWVYQLYVSYFEIYNEMVYDLLDLSTLTTVQVAESKQPRGRGRPRGRKRQQQAAVADDPLAMSATQIGALPRTALLVRTEGGRSNEPFVDGVTAVRVRGVRDLARVLVHGQLRRSVHATGLNAGSSRSHALLQARLVKIRRSAVVGPATTPATASSSVLVGQASVRGLTV
ncbi:Kinesin-like protein kif23, partial [Linderina macrospora]